MSLAEILIILVIVLFGGLPVWHLHPYGSTPSLLAIILIIVLLFAFYNRRNPL